MIRLNKAFYLGSQIGLFLLSLAVFSVAIFKVRQMGPLRFSPDDLVQLYGELHAEGMFLILLAIAASVVCLSLVYEMWASIQDGHARTSPGKAVGFLFIPFFQAYWFFQVWWGFAKDYNSFLRRHSLQVPELSEGLFLTFSILPLLAWIPFLGWAGLIVDCVLFLVIVASVCDAVNALPGGASVRGAQAGAAYPVLQRHARSLALYCVSGEFGGNQVGIPAEGIVIGRNPSRSNLVLASDEVSGIHVRVWPDVSGSGLWAEDLNSTNGTYYWEGAELDGRHRWLEIRGRKLLGNGAHFRVGLDVAEFEVRFV